MQSQDEIGNIKQSTEVDLTKASDLLAKIKTAEEKGAVSHTIGKLPKAGENITVNSLSYHVDFADYVNGKFRLKLTLRKE